ncbi:LRP2 [Mytilus coruscus]|uniref:LRP2 n=1 Tax=Mytilus coruscus TaxID=42192 RepID=A0A6J8CKJ1_MYTCO|nr:LRP2 [Mytilus coruscus]
MNIHLFNNRLSLPIIISVDYDCELDMRKCKDGLQCIDVMHMCNGYLDCKDGSDESLPLEMCLDYDCGLDIRKCQDGLQCIDEKYVCDGYRDCKDGSDESLAICLGMEGIILDTYYECKENDVKCADGLQCIPGHVQCDRSRDCNDDSDEHIDFCKDFECLDGWTKCGNGVQCIRKIDMCDGYMHCNDRSEENTKFCKAIECEAGHIKCKNGQCISNYLTLCDRHNDCYDKSDEDEALCKVPRFKADELSLQWVPPVFIEHPGCFLTFKRVSTLKLEPCCLRR